MNEREKYFISLFSFVEWSLYLLIKTFIETRNENNKNRRLERRKQKRIHTPISDEQKERNWINEGTIKCSLMQHILIVVQLWSGADDMLFGYHSVITTRHEKQREKTISKTNGNNSQRNEIEMHEANGWLIHQLCEENWNVQTSWTESFVNKKRQTILIQINGRRSKCIAVQWIQNDGCRVNRTHILMQSLLNWCDHNWFA